MIRFDENGMCTTCGLPGSGYVDDGVCECLSGDDEEYY